MSNHFSAPVRVAVALISATILLMGCAGEGDETGPASGLLSEATMATAVDENSRPVGPTTVFPTDAELLCCSFKITDAPPGTEIIAEWVYVGGEVEEEVGKNCILETMNAIAEGTCYTYVAKALTPMPDYQWPRGDYKIVLYVNGEEQASVPFKIE